MYFLSLSTSVPDFVNKGNCFWLLLLSQYRLCAYQVKQNHIMTKNFTEVLCAIQSKHVKWCPVLCTVLRCFLKLCNNLKLDINGTLLREHDFFLLTVERWR